jgi:hypothetical protein
MGAFKNQIDRRIKSAIAFSAAGIPFPQVASAGDGPDANLGMKATPAI